MRTPTLVPSLLALAVPAAAQTHWTVDDDGPADFADVAAAVAAVGAGDVLLIQPGNYGPVTLTKRLALLGDPSSERPHLAALTIDGAPGFDLAHLAVGATVVRNAHGPARIDDCDVHGVLLYTALRIDDSGPILIQGCTISAPKQVPDGASAMLAIHDSVVAVVDSLLIGGNAGADYWKDGLSGFGGSGLQSAHGSSVLLSGSTVLGGGGEDLAGLWAPSFQPGAGGPGVIAINATIQVRGSGDDLLRGGYQNYDVTGVPVEGPAIRITSGGSVDYSGVAVEGDVDPGAILLDPAAPHLYVRGPNAPGDLKRASFFGAAGAVGVVAVSLVPAELVLPGVEGTLWLSPAALLELVPLLLAGQDVPANHVWVLPLDPSLAGLAAVVQGVVVDPLRPLVATNPAAILLGF